MPTTTDVPDVLDRTFEAIRIGQDVWISTCRTWAEVGQRMWPAFFSASSDGLAGSMEQVVDASFDHARKLLEAQEACARAMINTAEPMPGRERTSGAASRSTSRGTGEKAATSERNAA